MSTGIKTCFLLRACPLLLIDEEVTVAVETVVVAKIEVGVTVDFLAITTGLGEEDEEAVERLLPLD